MHREGPIQGVRVRARAERTQNMHSMVVTLEVSKLSGWLNADAPCRVKGRGMRCGARCGPGSGRACGAAAAQAASTGKARLKAWRPGHARGERTKNMAYMVVTLDVSQLEMSALKFFKYEKSQLMSVIIETSQPAMEPPYV